jgi:hypothetical protein
MPSHADTIATALRERVAAIGASVGTAGRGFTRAVQGVAQGADIMDVMQAAVDAVVAAEALHKAADAAVKDLRAALQDAIDASGCAAVQTEHHTASLKRKSAFVTYSDRSLVPHDYYVERLDEKAVLSALKDGLPVPGASLAQPNAMVLAIRSRNVP